VDVEYIQEIARFIATRECEHLVDRKVQRVEAKSYDGIADGWQEPPCGIMGPFHFGCFVTPTDDASNESREARRNLDRISCSFENTAVRRESLGYENFRIVKIIEIVADPERVGLEVEGGAPGKMAPRRPIGSNQSGDICLKRR
jgi:hypothetical protein